ncbi:MAG: monovalent cation/H+ antiporter subunit D family protein [Alphaproteobacteria bacterium]|nr:monovalent cation/H+ antiporter subunit D family protein [Alphaproteobacteria bacterium]
MRQHLAILQVMLPMLCAPLCVFARRPVIAWLIATAATLFALAGSFILFAQALNAGVISYHLGGWAPPWGIEFRLDAANSFVLIIVSLVGAVCMIYGRDSIPREIKSSDQPLFYTMMMLCFSGMLGVTSTGDAFNLFVFLEIFSLSSYVLVAMGAGSDRRALTAAFTYLLLGTIGATFFVIGLGFIYVLTGTLNMADIAVRIAGMSGSGTLHVGFAFIIVGIGLKLAIFPLHLWLPNAYTHAPSVVTALLAGTSTKVALYALLRMLYTVFSPDLPFEALILHYLFLPLGLTAVFVASIIALFQSDVKRLLAWSSIAQSGYFLLGVSFANIGGLTATLVHMFNHAIMKSSLFLAVGCVVYRTGSCSVASFRGLGQKMPWTMSAFVIGGLSMIGVPATVGFVSKWYLVLAALERGWWPVAFAIVAGSLLALFYFGRVIEAAYLQPSPENSAVTEAPVSMLAPLWALTISCLALGINSELTVSTARAAAEALLAPHAGLPAHMGP